MTYANEIKKLEKQLVDKDRMIENMDVIIKGFKNRVPLLEEAITRGNQQLDDLRDNRDWLAKELVKMQDSLTSCQGELQTLQNKHRKLREAVRDACNFPDGDTSEGDLCSVADLTLNDDNEWILKEQEGSHE